MSSTWKIGLASLGAGDAVTFASLNASNLVIHTEINGLDEATFRIQGATILTDACPLTSGESYRIYQDDQPKFYGRLLLNPRRAESNPNESTEAQTVRLVGLRWWLEHTTYMQSWKVYDTVGAELTNVNKGRVVLFQNAAGTRITYGAQIDDVIDWAIARGAPIEIGTIDAGIQMPFDERENITCAEVLDHCQRLFPDILIWFDYTTPTPTFHAVKRANIASVDLDLTSTTRRLTVLDITPRADLVKPGVTVQYEKTHDVDGVTYRTVETDSAGDTAQFDSIYLSYDLQGSSATYLRQKITTENLPADLNDKTWWKARLPWLNNIADGDLTITDAAKDAAIDSYSRILIAGIVQDWMTGKEVVQGCIRAKADVIIKDGTTVLERAENLDIAVDIPATDASTGTYQRLSSYDSGESTPTGIAAELWAAWSILHYEGLLTIHQDEVDAYCHLGHTLNITNGVAAWATMATLIQAIDESIDDGVTTVKFGPPAPVEADNLMGLFRALRVRRFSWSQSTRAAGTTSGSGQVELSGASPYASSSHGGGDTKRKRIADTDGTDTHITDINPAGITFDDAGDQAALNIQLREILCLENDGGNLVYKRRQALVSESYHAGAAINPSSIYAFGCTLNEAGTQATVAAGKVRIHGIVAAAVSSGAQTLTGSTCYVYVEYVRSAKTASIKTSSTEPSVAAAGVLNVPLASYTLSGSVYVLAAIHHIGDINFDAPIL
jgi:hypothetical protein